MSAWTGVARLCLRKRSAALRGHAMGNKTEQALLHQHRIDEFEIERRKALFGFGAPDEAALLQARSHVLPALDAVVEAFYRQQTANEEIALIIGDSETMRRLRL